MSVGPALHGLALLQSVASALLASALPSVAPTSAAALTSVGPLTAALDENCLELGLQSSVGHNSVACHGDTAVRRGAGDSNRGLAQHMSYSLREPAA